MSQLYKKEGHNQELFLYMSFNHSPLPLILPDRQLSYHFLKPFRMLPDILLRNSIIPVHLPEIRPTDFHSRSSPTVLMIPVNIMQII